ncbi:hypothetical protein AKJ44_00405 [candidate division MSBL1 archaeon SCGC-AAA261F17]|uniref:Winged helix-turn-helix domain-containing protein n=1 Tax=candidate division MSBL1 archaeon SCGC-AAA261F17 TaxID=1698274 RepID=A0A133V7P9_9EURY|nr:hypothetical protein AKJ44_00405 [candidate division MSBL1 archaeon SCGC-AAA261F17]
MKKHQIALREILYQNYEKRKKFLSQKSISEACSASIGTVNSVVKKLGDLGVIEKKPLGFRIRDVKKVLHYWAATRDLEKDVVYTAYSPDLPKTIEEKIPPEVAFTAYSGFRRRFGVTPTDYSKVYLYGDPNQIARIFRQKKKERNIYVLEQDARLKDLTSEGVVPLVQLYADLWQLPPPANRFLEELKQKLKPTKVKIGKITRK